MNKAAWGLLPFILILLLPHAGGAMFHLMTGANHAELAWRSLSTEHFRIHYHQGLEQTARDCADIAEQVYGPITRQLGVEPRGRTELAITDVDAVVNGFAFRDRIAIWVHQNDYIKHFSQRREWLHQVIAHEFQHTVAFEALRDWRGAAGLGLSGTPAWWMEGLAEYYTEHWNLLRSDEALRRATLDRRLKESEAHDAGYAKVLYLAWRDGDSTLVKITRWRHPRLRTHSFRRAFKEVTGQSLSAFEEEWSRLVFALYHTELALGEALDEIGRRVETPLARVDWMALLPDSSAWVAVGRDSLSRRDRALYRISCDSMGRADRLAQGRLLDRAALSSDGGRVVFARSLQDRHGSWIPDLWALDLATGREARLTSGARAQDPALATDGALAWLATSGDRHRLMLEEDGETRVLWDPGPGWEMMRPDFSPDGRRLALATDDPESCRRITLLDRARGGATHLEPHFEDERDPVWISDSLLAITVFADFRANLAVRDLHGGLRRVSDSGEGLRSLGAVGHADQVCLLTLALDSARVSRPLLVDPARQAVPAELPLHARYTSWRHQMPEIRVPDWRRGERTVILADRRYNPWALKPLAALLLPLPGGGMGVAALADPLMKNMVTVTGGVLGDDLPVAQVGWENRQLDWTLGLAAGWNTGYGLVLVDDRVVEVNSSHLSTWLGRRWPFFAKPYEQVALSIGLRLEDGWRTGDTGDTLSSPFLPVDGRRGQVSLTAAWSGRPLEADAVWWPSWSHGLQLHGALARPWILGDEQLDYWRAGLYRIQPLFHPAARLVASARLDAFTGKRHTWRALGFSPDPLLNALDLGDATAGVAGLPSGPVSHLRALPRTVAGDRVFQASLELRLSPGAPPLFQVLDLANGRLTLAPFADVGHVADRARLEPGQPALWLWTSGLELQLGLVVKKLTIASLGLGVGGEDLDWLRASRHRQSYWRILLSRPI
jgi:hypothetical protein